MDFGIDTSLLPKRGDAAFVHCFHDAVDDTEVSKMTRGSRGEAQSKEAQEQPL